MAGLTAMAFLFVGCDFLMTDLVRGVPDSGDTGDVGEFCAGYEGDNACCTPDDWCLYGDDEFCDCDGFCDWDQADCASDTDADSDSDSDSDSDADTDSDSDTDTDTDSDTDSDSDSDSDTDTDADGGMDGGSDAG